MGRKKAKKNDMNDFATASVFIAIGVDGGGDVAAHYKFCLTGLRT